MAQYYYLVAGLPDILQGIPKKGLLYDQVIDEINDELTEQDRTLLELIRYRFDCDNLASILEGKSDFDNRGVFNRLELEQEISSPDEVPAFMQEFLEYKKEGKEFFPGLGLKEQILVGYYGTLLENENQFVQEWASFELDLLNLIAARSAKGLGLSPEKSVIPLNDNAEKFAKSSAADFGVSGHINWLDAVLSNFSTPKKLEMAIDTIRWQKADELCDGCWFGVEEVLAFTVKFNTVARWMQLDPETGLTRLNDLLQSMKSMASKQNSN